MELPPETRDALRFVLVDSIDEVFDAAFGSNGTATNGSRAGGDFERIGTPPTPTERIGRR